MLSLSNAELGIVLDAQMKLIQQSMEQGAPVAEALANAARIARKIEKPQTAFKTPIKAKLNRSLSEARA